MEDELNQKNAVCPKVGATLRALGVESLRCVLVVCLIVALLTTGCSQTSPTYISGCIEAPPADTSPDMPLPPRIAAGDSVATVAVIGDSYTTQPPPWTDMVVRQLGTEGMQTDVTLAGEGGSGYLKLGNQGTVFGQRIPKAVQPEDALIVFFGSRNDSNCDPAALGAAASGDWARAKRIAPNATLLAVGPIWPEGNPPDKVLRVRDILRERAAAEGVAFVDPIAEAWLTGPGLLKPDGVHPNAAGNQYLAEQMAPLIQKQLANLTPN